MPNGKAQMQAEEISGGQMAALLAGVAIEMPRKGNLSVVKEMIAHTRKMRSVLRQLVKPKDEVALAGEEALRVWHSGWPRFWRAFGFSYDHESLALPEYRDGFGWSIVAPDRVGWPMSRLLHEVCGRMFETWQYYDDAELDGITSLSPELAGVHVVLARDRVEADEEYKNQSAKAIKEQGVSTMTPRQRAVLESRHFFETNGHLDISNVTIHAGPRDADGYVPGSRWSGGGFGVGRVDPGGAFDRWRVREKFLPIMSC
ncbi:MAG: hypothetical protein WC387_04315 [Candidatus Paceibacterota bacterium]|jgi:hypothetical protein